MSAFAAAVGEADLQQLLELEDRSIARLLQPRGERAPAVGGDRVAGAATPADGVVGRSGVPVGDELLRLLVQLALRTRPHPAHAAVDLLDELVGGPRLDGQEAEDRVRRRGHRRRT